ncbi:tautomerase family protein [Rouxiella sp. S1S-2]|uniref:tautomerase family protein n=1 Tax=Rouxiella sp. S1S-2 TaxID=2653856 RepID=UPI001D0238EB|nr:tautomerase family protein [Rouxiella sp. S1S-2]
MFKHYYFDPRGSRLAYREKNMPEIVVYAVEGRSDEQKAKLMKKLTEAVVESFDVDAERVVVSIVETKAVNKSRGGVPFSELNKKP